MKLTIQFKDGGLDADHYDVRTWFVEDHFFCIRECNGDVMRYPLDDIRRTVLQRDSAPDEECVGPSSNDPTFPPITLCAQCGVERPDWKVHTMGSTPGIPWLTVRTLVHTEFETDVFCSMRCLALWAVPRSRVGVGDTC